MFVTNHALSGALIGRALKGRPVAAFVAGMASHLLLDTVPHWGCDTERPGGPEKFYAAAKKDGLLGLAAIAVGALAVERSVRAATLAGMAGAVLLDLDKPTQHFFNVNPFPQVIQRFHSRVQNESPQGLPNELRFGFAFTLANVVSTVMARGGLEAYRKDSLHRLDSARTTVFLRLGAGGPGGLRNASQTPASGCSPKS